MNIADKRTEIILETLGARGDSQHDNDNDNDKIAIDKLISISDYVINYLRLAGYYLLDYRDNWIIDQCTNKVWNLYRVIPAAVYVRGELLTTDDTKRECYGFTVDPEKIADELVSDPQAIFNLGYAHMVD